MEEEGYRAGREKKKEKGRYVKEGKRSEQKIKRGVEVRFCVCVGLFLWSASSYTLHTHTHTGEGRKEGADGDTYQKVASSERVCSCFLVCVRPKGERLVGCW